MSATFTRSTLPLDETAVTTALTREGLRASGWSNAPGDAYGAHSHGYDKVLYCVRGSIVFRLPGTGEEFELRAGDRLEIAAGTEHSAVVGGDGVACVEAARGAGHDGGS
ncbi:MAG TPA: cupin domain-containing protein [Dehalococcoidia bacterium]|nr:cupin domain-containing protein [Dehalococcoidia bacterium]